MTRLHFFTPMSPFVPHEIDLFNDAEVAGVSAFLEGAESIFIKKLALNDWQWAELKSGGKKRKSNQAGPYIPKVERDSGFFPKLAKKQRKPGEADILECFFPIEWPTNGSRSEVHLVNYRSKGEETHLTCLPKEVFAGLNPASLLLISRRNGPGVDPVYQAVIVDSSGADFDYLRNLFELKSDFVAGVFRPVESLQSLDDRIRDFVARAISAYRKNNLPDFAKEVAGVPSPQVMADKAAKIFLKQTGLKSLNPLEIDQPGDVTMRLTRDIEFDLYREYELKSRSLRLVNLILGFDSPKMTVENALIRIIRDYPKISSEFISSGNQRKARAGISFELHLKRLLIDGKIPFDYQSVRRDRSRQRPDFLLPSYASFSSPTRAKNAALVLSAKTTLRERWKQVTGEAKNCDLYLVTLDDSIASDAIRTMAETGIFLVVPESHKNSKTTVYKNEASVFSFSQFFRSELKTRHPSVWNQIGA